MSRGNTSSTDSASQDNDMEEFRPVAMVTRKLGGSGEEVSADLASLRVREAGAGW